MSAPDDLAPLLSAPSASGAAQNLAYRQGVVAAWNPVTAENTVVVGGVALANLPILNTSEALLLSAGDVVAVLAIGGPGAATWAILGRLTIPGTSQAATAMQAVGTSAAVVAAGESTTATSYGDLPTAGPTVAATIGASGRALVTIGALISTHAAFVGGYMSWAMTGANSQSPGDGQALGIGGTGGLLSASMSRAFLLTGLASGSVTLTAKYRSDGGSGAAFSGRTLSVVAL